MGKGGKKRQNKKTLWLMEYLLALPFLLVVRLLPFSLALRLGGAIGALAYMLDKHHRKVAADNIASCIDGLGPGGAENMARSAFVNLGYTVMEFIHSGRYARVPVEKHFTFVNFEAFERAYAKGRGVLCLTGHCGNWELMAQMHSLRGYPSGVVVRPLDNPYFDRLVTSLRSRYGNKMIRKNGGMKDMLRVLSEGRSVGVLLDQNVERASGVFVDFFGRPACTNKGMALLAAKTRAAVVPMFTHRTSPGKNVIICMDEIPLVDTGDKEADVRANTQNYTSAIEDFIRQHPEQWFWMHRRWKTMPEGAADA